MTTTFRLDILEMINRSKTGDVGLAFSYADLVEALYFGDSHGQSVLKYDAAKPQWEGRDYVVLSNPEAWPVFEVALKKAGFLDEILSSKKCLKIPGLEMAFKSPGQGLSVAYGVAQSLQISKKKNRIYVLLDDEDLKNGQAWEAIMGIAYDRLSSVMAICSHSGTSKLEPLQDKFEAFGWKVFKLMNGHDQNEILNTIAKAKQVERQPVLLLAPTVLGKGIPFMEGKQQYKGALFSEAEMEEAVEILKAQNDA